MTETTLLHTSLVIAFVLAPLLTNRFYLRSSRIYLIAHITTLAVLLFGTILNQKLLTVVWPVFCLFGMALYLKQSHRILFSVSGLATFIPFVFSIVSAIWFFAGVNDLHLLGYNQAFSFYAALHGLYLGWMFVGCLGFLSQRQNFRRVYTLGCYLSFVFFLFVAFGIDGVPYLKRIGAIGFSLLFPALIGLHFLTIPQANHASRRFAALSLVSIVFSMSLALANEFWISAPRFVGSVPIMVIAHGLTNAMFTVPCFFLAILFSESSNNKQKPFIYSS